MHSDSANAFLYFKKGLELAESIPYQDYVRTIYGDMGVAYSRSLVFDKAIENLQLSLQMCEALKDTAGMAADYNNIGILYLDLEEFEKAKPYFEKQCELSKLIMNMHGCAIGKSNMGDYFYGIEEFDKALECYKFSLNIVDSLEMPYGVMHCQLSIADVYRKKGFHELSLDFNRQGYEAAKQLGYKRELAWAALSMAQTKAMQGNYRESIRYGEEALELAHNFSSIKRVAETYKNLSDSYESMGNLEKAISYRKKYELAKDSLFVENKLKIFGELGYKFQVEKKEAENQFLKNEQEKNQTIIRQRTAFGLAVALGLVLAAILLAVLYQRNRQKQSSNEQLEQEVEKRTEHLTQANEKLTKANIELERFAHVVSHDLKEPVRNIVSFAGLTKRAVDRQNEDGIREYLQFIIDNSRQMNGLIEDILDFSRIDADFAKHKMMPLSSIMERAQSDISLLLREKKGRIVENWPENTFKPNKIQLPFQLSMVFKNLLENGIKYNKSKVPTVQVDCHQTDTDLIFSVKDNGIGIPADYQDSIFEMFERLHSRGEYEGSGIGLAICQKIVSNLKGQISLTSKENKGSNFEVSIPLNFAVIS